MAEAGRALLRHLFDDLGMHKVEALIRAGQQAVGRARQAPGISPGGRADPRPLARSAARWHSVMLYGLIAGEER